jgi:hypothetical protein
VAGSSNAQAGSSERLAKRQGSATGNSAGHMEEQANGLARRNGDREVSALAIEPRSRAKAPRFAAVRPHHQPDAHGMAYPETSSLDGRTMIRRRSPIKWGLSSPQGADLRKRPQPLRYGIEKQPHPGRDQAVGREECADGRRCAPPCRQNMDEAAVAQRPTSSMRASWLGARLCSLFVLYRWHESIGRSGGRTPSRRSGHETSEEFSHESPVGYVRNICSRRGR